MTGKGKEEQKTPFTGRWVARLRGRIVGHGGTPGQALRAARAARFKEIPEISYMPHRQEFTFSPLLDKVRAVLPDGVPVYLVGGTVRDALLGRETHDLDFALPCGGVTLARRAADALGAAFYPLDRERDTGRVISTDEKGERIVMDFAAFRGADLEGDLRGRDFTANALALDVRTQAIHDPLGGAADIRAHLLRACAASAFQDDPLRILRGVRLAAVYSFKIQPETRKMMKQALKRLSTVTAERLRDELFRMLESNQAAAALRVMDMLGALQIVLPELAPLKRLTQPAPHVYDGWEHTMRCLNHLQAILSALAPVFDAQKRSDLFTGLLTGHLGRYRQQISAALAQPEVNERTPRGLLFFAALYHDAAKPQCGKVQEDGRLRYWGHDEQGALMATDRASRLQLSSREISRVAGIIRHHMRVHFHTKRLYEGGRMPSRRAIYRFFRDTGEMGVDVCLLTLADLRATYEHTLSQDMWQACLDVCRIFLENWWEKPAESIDPPALLNGDDLMSELGMQPGPQVGILLEALREAQATGRVNDRPAALEFLRERRNGEGK